MKILSILVCMAIGVMPLVAQSPLGSNEGYYCPPCGNDCDKLKFDQAGDCRHCGMVLIRQTSEQRQQNMKEKKLTIGFYLQDGVEVLDFAGPMEVFSYSGFTIFTISKTKAPIVSQGVLKVMPDYDIDNAPEADILAFFGGNASSAFNDSDVIAWVKSSKADYYFSVCTGAFILGKAGLLDNQTATTFHSSIDALKKEFPKAKVLSNVRFVDNGRIITTAGISAGIDGALHLVARLKGNEVAKNTAYYMEYDKWIPGEGLIVSK